MTGSGGPRLPQGASSADDRTSARTVTRRVEGEEPIDRLLERRRGRGSWGRRFFGGCAALALHVSVIGGAIVAPQLFAKPQKPVEFVPVQLVPAPKRGVVQPAPTPPPAAAPTPAPVPEPTPPPEPTKAPEPEKRSDEPTTATPAPTIATAATPTPPPAPQGAPNGRPDSPFVATVGGVDNPTFTYGYYLDRMLLLIRAQWVRPPLGSGVEATVHFRILRDGSVEDIELTSSSGYNSFDLAALRAVQAAGPLPPLPRSYREDALGVNLVFH
jgi:TonB family protein